MKTYEVKTDGNTYSIHTADSIEHAKNWVGRIAVMIAANADERTARVIAAAAGFEAIELLEFRLSHYSGEQIRKWEKQNHFYPGSDLTRKQRAGHDYNIWAEINKFKESLQEFGSG